MASKAQLLGIINTQLASNQPILAEQHRAQIITMLDELYNAQSRGNVLAGLPLTSLQLANDTFLAFRNGAALQIPFSSIFDDPLTLGTPNGLDLDGTVLSLGLASANTTGALSDADFNIFSAKQDEADKGQPNGYAQLDSGAKIPISLIPDSVLGQVEYEGTWNATTNTPTLPNTPDKKGEYYVVSTAGTFVGIDFQVGDWIISNGVEWEKVNNTDAVRTVFGRLGDVVANANDYNVFYVRHDTNGQGLNNTQKGNARTNINAEPTFAKNTGFNKDFGTVANTVTQGNDVRLSDARVPLAHTHVIGDVTGLQTALNLKAPLESPTFTGTVSGINKSMVGLGNVDNTSDLNKPISTATQTALNNKKNAFAENTGFNKNFGTIAGTVAQGNDSRFHAAATLGTANGLSLTNQVLSLGLSSANSTGALSDTDFNTFNNKAPSVAGGYLPLSGGTLTGALNGTNAVFSGGVNDVISVTSTASTTAIKLNNTNANDFGSNVAFQSNSVNRGFVGLVGSLIGNTDHSICLFGTTGQSVKFFTNSNTSPRLTLDASTGAATLTGALNGTSASFSGLVSGGDSSPSDSYNAGSWFTGDGLVAGNLSSVAGIQINSSSTSTLSAIRFGDGDGANNLYDQGFINYRHTIDSMIFGTNRNTALTIDSTGAATFISSVTAAGYTISSGGATSVLSFLNNASGGARSISYGVSTAAININDTGGNPLVTFLNGGNVGIGTTDPSAKLEVSGGHIRINDGFSYQWGSASSSINGNSNSNFIGLITNNTERLRITSAGRIQIALEGIPTSDPIIAGQLYRNNIGQLFISLGVS